MISTRQAQALRLQCTKALGMSEKEYKGMLLNSYGVNSSKELGEKQYNDLMTKLKGVSAPGRFPKPDKQLRLIYALWGELYCVGKVQHKGVSPCLNWMRKYLAQPEGAINFTSNQKSRCIESLKRWLER